MDRNIRAIYLYLFKLTISDNFQLKLYIIIKIHFKRLLKIDSELKEEKDENFKLCLTIFSVNPTILEFFSPISMKDR